MTVRTHAWHPTVPGLREVYHAEFDHAYPMHLHDDWTVLLVDSGAVEYDLDRHSHLATPGALTLLPPGIAHDGHSALDGKQYVKRVLYFTADWLPAGFAERAADRPTLVEGSALSSVRSVHAALAEPGDALAAEVAVLNLRGSVHAHLGGHVSRAADVPLARRLRGLLDDQYTRQVSIAEAAALLNTHPSHLVRVFSQTYGISPHQYVLARRIDAARRLLVRGTKPAAVAAETGFHDQAHLTRHFKRVLGTTPGAFAR